jgi:hypothetical protein
MKTKTISFRLQCAQDEQQLRLVSFSWGSKQIPFISIRRDEKPLPLHETLDLFEVTPQHDDYAVVACASSIRELRGHLKRKEECVYPRASLDGEIRVLRHSARKGILTITGQTTFHLKVLAEVYPFPKISRDGTHAGPSDFYPETQDQILRALRSGNAFDTGWMSCKKKSLSSRLRHDGVGGLTCEVSISNDFDDEGTGTGTVDFAVDGPKTDEEWLKLVETGMAKAHAAAAQDQKDNASVEMFTVGRVNDEGKRVNWVETYLQDRYPHGFPLDTPPGDYYHQWGWQGETDEIPAEVLEKLEDAIFSGNLPCVVDGWMVEPAKD